jgi:hypothetical protein
MRIDATALVEAPPDDVYRYLSDPRNVLHGSPWTIDIVESRQSGPGSRRYWLSSRIAPRDRWDVEVQSLSQGRKMRIEFSRRGKTSRGWFEYDLELQPGGTLLRTTGEIHSGHVVGAVNAFLARFHRARTQRPDRGADARISRWLAANPKNTVLDVDQTHG